MNSKFFQHLPHYLPLIGIFVASILGFWIFSYSQQFQTGVAIAVAISYVVWGLVHHMIHKDLYLEIILEYIFMAGFGLVILLSLIYR